MTEVVDRAAALEVRWCFLAYEEALAAGDADATDAWFLDGADTIRFGVAEEQWGIDEIRHWRRSSPPVPAGRALTATDIRVCTPDVAVVTTLFGYPGTTEVGRQSQTWLRTAAGWRIVHAHVSVREAGP